MKNSHIRELYEQYETVLADWQIKLAIARMMRYRVPHKAWQDTMQELAIVICQFKFDSSKAQAASERTILCRHLDNRIRMLARANARRLAMLKRFSLMRHHEVDDHDPVQCAAHGDVREMVQTLTPLQQRICHALGDGQSVPQIAKATGKHYTTICRHISHIATAFDKGGFDACAA